MSLTITPDKQIGFTLSRGDNATKSMLTLANNTGDYFAFKVKTTQPKRYLVRPNQGLVKPGESEEVTIILVDKDKQMLLTDFEQIGPSALESSKDKFLIQSSKVEEEFYNTTKAKGSAKDLAKALTTMWQKISAEKTLVSNTKLQVKHTVNSQSLSSNNNSSSAGYGAVQQSADRIREGMQGTSQNGQGSEGLMLGYEEDVDALRPPSPPPGAEALANIPVDNGRDDEPIKDAGSPLHQPPLPSPAVSLTDLDGDADQGVDFDSPALVTGDIEMGNVTANPMHKKGKLESGDSIKAFGNAVKEEAARAAGKGLGGGVGVKQGVNTEALGKLMEGGGGFLERLNIAINWVQNLGLIMLFEVAWPESFKKWWKWMEMLRLDFDIFGGMGEDFSIALGLLVPAWLVWEFDAGLFWERTYFGFVFMVRWGEVLVYLEDKVKFTLAGLLPVAAIVLSCINVSEGWITSDLVNAFLLVLSGLSFLSFLHQVYLWRETKVCDSANEDFAKKRQENQMFFFLFFYTVAYLSGVSACTKLLVAEETVEKIMGGILLPFYVLVPLWKLRGEAAFIKAAVKEAAGEQSYQDSLSIFSKEAVESKINEVATGYDKNSQRLSRDSPGYKASVSAARP
ncbi:hypothetical protein TrVE_jg10709 [Triparma verrucosa]|uniref:MSP domain-containing protein n=1 Tax=Triparma verrucosa TaxID=1606542 RepID=A0A9W7BGZ5_9STRA|nr:hypothetical protein TrVE_jg10709 [Triparma verrucosa]